MLGLWGLLQLILVVGAAGLVLVTVMNFNALLQGVPAFVGSASTWVSSNVAETLGSRGTSHDHRQFLDSFEVLVKDSARFWETATLKQLAVHTRGASGLVLRKIEDIKLYEKLDEQEHKVLKQAEKVVNQLNDIETDTFDIATSSKDLFAKFSTRLAYVAKSYASGATDKVQTALTEIEEEIANTLGKLSLLHQRVSRVGQETGTLEKLTFACVEKYSRLAEQSKGEVQFPATTIALTSLSASLFAFTAVSFAPASIALGVGAGAFKMGVGAGVVTGMFGINERAKKEFESQQLSAHAVQLRDFALATHDIMQGVVTLNRTLAGIRAKVQDSQAATIQLKGAAHEDDVDRFQTLVDEAQSQYGLVTQQVTRLLDEWFNEERK